MRVADAGHDGGDGAILAIECHTALGTAFQPMAARRRSMVETLLGLPRRALEALPLKHRL
jgi:hypothetical protein